MGQAGRSKGRSSRRLLTWGVLLALVAVAGCLRSDEENEDQSGGATSAAAAQAPGVVTLSLAAQRSGGIVTQTLAAVSHRGQLTAYGSVLDLRPLAALRSSYADAAARAASAAASLVYTQAQYERAKALNAQATLSESDYQAARAAWQADRNDARAAQEAQAALEDEARQAWGDVVARWLVAGSPMLRDLLEQRDLLVQVSLPPDTSLQAPPDTASILAPDGRAVAARFLSQAPQADPRFQSVSFLYTVKGGAQALLPGMSVQARLPHGPPVEGFVIPSAAVVWHRGSAWVFVQSDSTRFTRHEVSTAAPVATGYFVTKRFHAGQRIVVGGAQVMLSQELRSEIQGGDEG